jgi:hypothetical protein
VLSPLSLLVYAPKVYQRKEEYEEKKTTTTSHHHFCSEKEQNENTSQGLWFQSLPGKRVWGNEKRQSCIDNH